MNIQLGVVFIEMGIKRLKLGYNDAFNWMEKGINTIKLANDKVELSGFEQPYSGDMGCGGTGEMPLSSNEYYVISDCNTNFDNPPRYGSGTGCGAYVEVIGGDITDNNDVYLMVSQNEKTYLLNYPDVEIINNEDGKQINVTRKPTMEDIEKYKIEEVK